MLECLAFWTLACATEFTKRLLAVSCVFDVCILFLNVVEPLERGIMLPRVKVLDFGSLNLLIRAFSWTIFVHELVFLLQ